MSKALYSIRVNGRLGDATLFALPDFESQLDGGDTLLTGEIADRAALYGVLGRLESLGLELIDMRRLDDPPPPVEM